MTACPASVKPLIRKPEAGDQGLGERALPLLKGQMGSLREALREMSEHHGFDVTIDMLRASPL